MQNSSGGMFIQWRCDLHPDEKRNGCTEVADDPGYCPSGCTYMMGKSSTWDMGRLLGRT